MFSNSHPTFDSSVGRAEDCSRNMIAAILRSLVRLRLEGIFLPFFIVVEKNVNFKRSWIRNNIALMLRI